MGGIDAGYLTKQLRGLPVAALKVALHGAVVELLDLLALDRKSVV